MLKWRRKSAIRPLVTRGVATGVFPASGCRFSGFGPFCTGQKQRNPCQKALIMNQLRPSAADGKTGLFVGFGHYIEANGAFEAGTGYIVVVEGLDLSGLGLREGGAGGKNVQLRGGAGIRAGG